MRTAITNRVTLCSLEQEGGEGGGEERWKGGRGKGGREGRREGKRRRKFDH